MIKQLGKFIIIGLFNTVLDFSIYTLFTRFFDFYFLYANIISVAIAGTSAFFLSKYVTFQDKNSQHLNQSLKFAMVAGSVFLLNNAILFALVHWLNIPDLIGKLIATGCVVAWSFGWQKWWVFRGEGSEKVV